MKEKVSLKEKIKNFFSDDRKRMGFILITVFILLLSIIIIALLFTKGKDDNDKKTTSSATTLTKDIGELNFRGYDVVELKKDDNYSLDLLSRHNIIYSSNKTDEITTCVDDLDLYYEVKLNNGVLEFKEYKYDESVKGKVHTGTIVQFKLEKKIKNFIIGHNCSDIEYTILVSDEGNNLYAYENNVESNLNIKEITKNIKKVKTISSPSKIGYYDGNNDPSFGSNCSYAKMVYLDKTNNIRTLDSKNTLFINTIFYRYIGNDNNGEVIYVLKDKTMKLSNKEGILKHNNQNVLYRGSFYTDDGIYIIDSQNYLYKINAIDEGTSTNLTPIKNNPIKRIGSRSVSENSYATDKTSVIIEFASDEIMTIDTSYEYEILS